MVPAYTPRYPKVQTEGWWLVFGDTTTDELKAFRRVTFAHRTTATLSVAAPVLPGTYDLALMLVSDAYLGLDQQYTVRLTVA